MSEQKRVVRRQFRHLVLERDRSRCRCCGAAPTDAAGLDAHHITDRHLMPSGGYVPENGIALCPDCHVKAEQFHVTGEAASGFAPSELYALIGSSEDQARRAATRATGA